MLAMKSKSCFVAVIRAEAGMLLRHATKIKMSSRLRGNDLAQSMRIRAAIAWSFA
ncbi:hypothetical protein [Dyella flagellata]|uniref:hypothetical protein n=1 Tax=Dyella flagellata TaxID=1867833 RepID=UPI0024E14214|nr:hypothetical protein [Dyella flagellata]